MATATSDRRNVAGGKVVKNRRGPPTPYERPEKNPNWLSGLVYPAKMIASGAGKLFAFFESDSSSSSSSGDSYDNDEEEEEEVEEVGNDVSSLQDGRSDKVQSPSSKSDRKHVIEQLVTQETFSRKEGNELIKLIKSRVVDANGNSDESASIVRITAIMQARKWLQQKGSGSKRTMESELDVTNLATPSQVSRNEKGSPVDMAKSYMQNRPAWGSPTSNHSGFGSSSPLGILQFKEETPKSTLRSSEIKRTSLSSGSWNILEEIRRVRSKAAEELLAATPLTKSHLKTNKVNDLRTAPENGFRSIVYSLAAEQDGTLKPGPFKEVNKNLVSSSQAGPDAHMDYQDPSSPDIVVNGSQNSSSFPHEEVSEAVSQSIEEQASVAKTEGPPRERKSRGGYTQRGRGRRGK